MIFDVQDYQLEEVENMTKERGMIITDQAPVVTMRLRSVNGTYFNHKERDLFGIVPSEWHVTYRDSLVETEKLMEGVLQIPEKGLYGLKVLTRMPS